MEDGIEMGKYKKYLIPLSVILVVLIFFLARSLLVSNKIEELKDYEGYIKTNNLLEMSYKDYLETYQSEINYGNGSISITPDDYNIDESLRINQNESNGYDMGVVRLNRGNEITFTINTAESGMYELYLDYFYIGNELLPPKIGLLINDEYPFYESRQLSFPVTWAPEVTDTKQGTYQVIHHYQLDRYNNEVQPKSSIVRAWQTSAIYDGSYFYGTPLLFYLEEGENVVKIISRSNDLLIGRVTFGSPKEIPDYKNYKATYAGKERYKGLITIEAEYYTYKSDPSIKLYSDTNPSSTNYHSRIKKLNAIDAYTWNEAGRSVTWEIDVPKDGLYKLGFKYIQYQMIDLPAYRKIEIDGEVPFAELLAYPFQYSTKWKNEVLGNGYEDYYFYLTEGKHEIRLTSVIDPYRPIVETLKSIMTEITDLSLDIKKLTGGKTDAYRDWKITEYIPDIADRLLSWADELDKAYRYGNSLNNTDKLAGELINLRYAEENLRELADDPDKIPNKLTALSEGSTSVSQYLGDLTLRLTKQTMGIEKFYLFTDSKLPKADANIFKKLSENIKQFFYSFKNQYSHYDSKDPDTIEVWVNRSRANIDLLQKMIDEEFTPKTGIKVNLSLMPNADKLILANAAGIQPDVALGVGNNTPYEFAIRNAVVDLRQFAGYEEIVANYPPGVLIPYIYADGVYGLPETIDFYLTFYRTDILDKLDIPVPDTWDEVTEILPELQQYGMNYYIPLGSSSSYKGFSITLPFYYQNNAKLYADDGMSTVIDSAEGYRAMKMMTDLFTIYDLPKQIPSFYNHIRYGTLPIGISSSSAYLQLLIAAPEIQGNWDIALYPGLASEDGEVKRYSSVSSSALMMFKSSTKQEKAFEFIKWWLSTDTQSRFAQDLQTMYGKEYMWFSANLKALESLSIDEEHKQIMLEQLEWAIETPNVPGGYYLEREISNAWNAIVFNDKNIRTAIDEAVLSSNREIKRKMTEFEYIVYGVKVKDFLVPTLENIDYWLKERRDDK